MLSRRELIALAALHKLFGQAIYRDYSRCLPDYLRDLVADAYERRNREVAKLTSDSAIRARQRWVTEIFWKLVGGEPDKTPLNARVVGAFEREKYRVEKVVYESQPGFHISANLYLPKGDSSPRPGVLFQMGHAVDGKAYDSYQRCCQGLVQLGFVVLGFDPMGQGERTYYPGPNLSRTRLSEGADGEHSYPGWQMLLKGDTATRLQTWDTVRSLDYLASRPEVDPKRLASTGQSGGGTNTMLLAAVDNRLAAAAISCPNSENFVCASFNPPGSTDDAEQNLLDAAQHGFDRWDLLYPFAPKPLLVIVSAKDSFGTYSPNYIESGMEEFAKLKKLYGVLGAEEKIAWSANPLPHGLEYGRRLEIYRWFNKWLRNDTTPVEVEPPTNPEIERDLFVASSGNVVRSFGGETPFTLTKKRTIRKSPADLKDLLRLDIPSVSKYVSVATTRFRNCRIEAIEVESAPKVWVPAWLYTPSNAAPTAKLIVVVEPGGRNAWHEGELYDQLAARGNIVCAPDLRGAGDLTPEFSRKAARHSRSHNNEEHYAWAALMLGRPLLGQRVTDLLTLVRSLKGRQEIALAARGSMTVPALCAAALEPAISVVYLSGGLVSFQSIAETENYQYPYGNFVPGFLNHTDLPEIATSINPRRIVIAGATDGTGKGMPADTVRSVYRATKNVEIRPDGDWTVAALAAL